jgi:hypothetical protein
VVEEEEKVARFDLSQVVEQNEKPRIVIEGSLADTPILAGPHALDGVSK